jgi:hypothetical protein
MSMTMSDLMDEWAPSNQSEDSFSMDPPNGNISVFNADGSKIRDAVVTLKTAKLEGDKLTFEVDVLEGALTSARLRRLTRPSEHQTVWSR